jgi:hypothetical protein
MLSRKRNFFRNAEVPEEAWASTHGAFRDEKGQAKNHADLHQIKDVRSAGEFGSAVEAALGLEGILRSAFVAFSRLHRCLLSMDISMQGL